MIQLLRNQRTISQPVRLTGHGYWVGKDVTVEFRPAAIDSGYMLTRADLPQPVRFPANPRHLVSSSRRTTMGKEGATVQMVEHGLAALAGLQIDNCELVVFGSELPGGDGSSQPAVEALLSAGIEVQDAERKCLRLERVIRVGDDQAWIEARPSTTVGCRIRYELDYGEGPIGKQSVEVKLTPESFCQELAAARTFLLAHEVDMMRRQGVGANTTYQDLLVFAENGPIGNRLRFSNECARHKALDVVGDLAIIGCDLNADIVAYRSGHVLNAQLARALHACYCEGPSAEISAQQG